MKTEEGNKLIAEFMGIPIGKRTGEYLDDRLEFPSGADKLKYHSSWDWLMPVVKRIRLGLGGDSYWFDHFNEALDSVDIEKIWMATVGFIKWNNEQK